MRNLRRITTRALAIAAVGTIALTAACGSSGSAGESSAEGDVINSTQPSDTAAGSETDTATLTLYSGQHEDFAQALADGFTAATGIKVTLRSGDDAELANQIIEEGDGSPADLFISEEPGPAALLDSKGLTSTVTQSTLDEVDSRLVPSTKGWMPYAARTRVIFYNPSLIDEADLPASIMDLTQPEWAGKFAYAPSGAFTSTVSYLIDTIGSDATLQWLEGIKANGVNEQKNGKVRDSVEAGQHPFGLSNHYYWYILAADQGADTLASKVHFFDHDDAGGLLLASGAAVLKSSQHQDEAQQFLAWLGSADGGQQVVADGTAAQFPVAPGVNSTTPGLPALADLVFPTVDPAVFADTEEAKDLIIKAGIA